MDDDRRRPFLKLGRRLLFAISVIFALGWMIAPDFVASERNRVAAFVRVRFTRVETRVFAHGAPADPLLTRAMPGLALLRHALGGE